MKINVKHLGALLIALFGLIMSISAFGVTGEERVLYSFEGRGNGGVNGQDGSAPAAGLIADAAGNLYGTTSTGGSSGNCYGGCGAVFQLIPPSVRGDAWTENILYNFQGGSDGWMPLANLTLDSAGNLYGTTALGGTGSCVSNGQPLGCGTVFELLLVGSPGNYSTETILYSFQGAPNDGALPYAGVVFDAVGNLYGTTAYGGPSSSCFYGNNIFGCGTVFELSPAGNGVWNESVLHSFYHYFDGRNPVAPVVFAPDGNLYGTTRQGGGFHQGCAGGCGTIFQLIPAGGGVWKERVLHVFVGKNQHDGAFPEAGFTVYQNALYGTTPVGGDHREFDGMVYKFAVTGQGPKLSILYTSSCGITGPVVLDSAGRIYGTEGGPEAGTGCQRVFQLDAPKPGNAWVYNVVAQLTDGVDPVGGVLLSGENLYGATYEGGIRFGNCAQNQGCGVIYSVVPH